MPRTKNPAFGVDGNPMNPRLVDSSSSEEERLFEVEGSGDEGEERVLGEEEEDEQEEGSEKDNDENESESEESYRVPGPLIPLEMYFKPTEYTKAIKIQSRCYIKKAVETINELLTLNEVRWFHEHPQFKHFFHMHLETKNKVMGMWMLLLHTAKLEKTREA